MEVLKLEKELDPPVEEDLPQAAAAAVTHDEQRRISLGFPGLAEQRRGVRVGAWEAGRLGFCLGRCAPPVIFQDIFVAPLNAT